VEVCELVRRPDPAHISIGPNQKTFAFAGAVGFGHMAEGVYERQPDRPLSRLAVRGHDIDRPHVFHLVHASRRIARE